MRYLFIFAFLMVLPAFVGGFYAASNTVQAQGLIDSQGKDPIEIEADEAIEWDRANAQYIARGNAVAIQGENRVYGDILIADYIQLDEGGTQVTQLTAQGNVRLVNPAYKAFGDKAIHDTNRNITTLTGRNLSFEGDNMVVTARDSLEHHGNSNKAYARGNARAAQGNDVVRADTLIAHFTENAQGEMILSHVHGTRNIVIVTPQETITGDKGDYDVIKEQALVVGNVKITRGENQMNGDRATVDMKTGLSRLFVDPSLNENADGTDQAEPRRVRALLFRKGDN